MTPWCRLRLPDPGGDTPIVTFTTAALVANDTLKFQVTISDDHPINPLMTIEEVTIDDPEYYREPWTVTLHWQRTDDVIRDYDCVVRPHLAVGQ